MRQSWRALSFVLLALGLEAGCNDYNTSIQYPTGASILTLAPSGVVFGSTGFTLTVIGSSSNGFKTTTVVEWNGQKLASTYVDAVTMTATVPASLVAKVGTAYVNTLTPQSGTGMNGLSNSIAFLVYGTPNPVPVVTSVAPNTAPACGSSCGNASLKITIAGSDFLSTSTNGASTVTFTGLSTKGVETAINVTNITSTQIDAVIPGAMLADADANAVINVINPPSGVCLVNCPVLGGGHGQGLTFTITGGAAAAAVAEETPALSQDGRYVAFSAQENETTQIMLRDTCLGVQNGCTPSTKTISVAADNTPGNADSHTPVISADGRYIAFSSAATNLLESAPAGRQVYLRDTCAGASPTCKAATSLVSTDPGGALNGTESIFPSISSSGRYIVFLAVTASHDAAKGKVPAAAASTNSGLRQVFLRDTCLGATSCTPKTTRISLSPGDTPANSNKPVGPALSGLAKQVALADRKSATVFTPTVPVDDQVFLAVPQEPKQ